VKNSKSKNRALIMKKVATSKKKYDYGPAPKRPVGYVGKIYRQDGRIISIHGHLFTVRWNREKGVKRYMYTAFSRSHLPRRKARKWDRVSVFFVSVYVHAVNINGKRVYYRDPRELWSPQL